MKMYGNRLPLAARLAAARVRLARAEQRLSVLSRVDREEIARKALARRVLGGFMHGERLDAAVDAAEPAGMVKTSWGWERKAVQP